MRSGEGEGEGKETHRLSLWPRPVDFEPHPPLSGATEIVWLVRLLLSELRQV